MTVPARPERGAVRLGGVDLRELSERDLRGAVVVLSQQAHLFSATVRHNLLIGRPEASEPELRQALQVARAAEFVDALLEGLDTWVDALAELRSQAADLNDNESESR